MKFLHAQPNRLCERYLAKVKALLRQELSAANGAAPASNGCSKNGAYGSDDDSERAGGDGDEDGAGEGEEAAGSSSSSSAPTAPARKARRSRSNGDGKKSPGRSRVTRSSGRQPTILSLFSKRSVRGCGDHGDAVTTGTR
ncbi:hypothetical protein AV530_015345 [Patagioenas fasciata monilis]|uniref:Uncharacterized protein n=1 Tax=Patagioenas fasciata monilis TaxID=372326 RepID=A0A1V4KMS0_PATFA|nr:hypothetical protein AV530_015345 [Patagioenas fasciata monilis]